jgi:hypothetical protein
MIQGQRANNLHLVIVTSTAAYAPPSAGHGDYEKPEAEGGMQDFFAAMYQAPDAMDFSESALSGRESTQKSDLSLRRNTMHSRAGRTARSGVKLKSQKRASAWRKGGRIAKPRTKLPIPHPKVASFMTLLISTTPVCGELYENDDELFNILQQFRKPSESKRR